LITIGVFAISHYLAIPYIAARLGFRNEQRRRIACLVVFLLFIPVAIRDCLGVTFYDPNIGITSTVYPPWPVLILIYSAFLLMTVDLVKQTQYIRRMKV
jgi:hypothetical protein